MIFPNKKSKRVKYISFPITFKFLHFTVKILDTFAPPDPEQPLESKNLRRNPSLIKLLTSKLKSKTVKSGQGKTLDFKGSQTKLKTT